MALMNIGDINDVFGHVDRMMNNVMRSMMGGMPDPFEMVNNMNMSMRPYGMYQPSALQTYSMGSAPMSAYTHYSSSVMSMSSDGYGRPQVYEATQSSRYAPGGVKETRSTVRDSRTGVHEMSIGRHIDDRAHIVQRSRNYYTGQQEQNDEFINLEEEEGPEFHREWETRQRPYARPRHDRRALPSTASQPEILAITSSESPEITEITSEPIITEPSSPRAERPRKRPKREKPYKKHARHE